MNDNNNNTIPSIADLRSRVPTHSRSPTVGSLPSSVKRSCRYTVLYTNSYVKEANKSIEALSEKLDLLLLRSTHLRKSMSSNWWTPLFGWSSEPDYIDSADSTNADLLAKSKSKSASDLDQKSARSRFSPGCFTEEKARQLRLMTKETSSFHDVMDHAGDPLSLSLSGARPGFGRGSGGFGGAPPSSSFS